MLNNGPNVSEKMRSRVLAAVEALGYQINPQAQLLARRSQRTILLICAVDIGSEPNSYYLSALEMGALRVAGQQGVEIVPHKLFYSLDAGKRVLDTVLGSGALGVVLTPPFSDDIELIERISASGQHVVCISPGINIDGKASCVSMDEEEAGYALATYLISLGHRRFGFIMGRPDHKLAQRRHEGTLRALRESGLEDKAMMTVEGDFTFKGGRDALPALMSGAARPTAVICANDDTAVGALFAAHRSGLVVPNELSIGSFDDTPISALVWPPLTTIHQPIEEMGSWAIQRIISNTGENGNAQSETLSFELIVRESTAPPMQK